MFKLNILSLVSMLLCRCILSSYSANDIDVRLTLAGYVSSVRCHVRSFK